MFDIEKQEYLSPSAVRDLCKYSGVAQRNDADALPLLTTVPILNTSTKLSDFGPIDDPRALVDNILKFAEGPGMNKGVRREGVVFKSNNKDFSMKAVSNSYLLAKDKAS